MADPLKLMLAVGLLIMFAIPIGVSAIKSSVTLWKSEPMRLRKIKMAVIRYVFRGSCDSVALKLVRRFNMEKGALKHLMYGGIEEMLRDRRYYYHSTVGESYSYWTEEGKEAIAEFMSAMAYKIRAAEEADLEKRAKEQTLAALKG